MLAGPPSTENGFGATDRRRSSTSKERRTWVIREVKIRAKRKLRKKPSILSRKNEN